MVEAGSSESAMAASGLLSNVFDRDRVRELYVLLFCVVTSGDTGDCVMSIVSLDARSSGEKNTPIQSICRQESGDKMHREGINQVMTRKIRCLRC